jgi:hypothetical protein
MNGNTSASLLPGLLRPIASKPGSRGLCSGQEFWAGFGQWACLKASQGCMALPDEVSCYDRHPDASAVLSQTVGPVASTIRYFPL